MWKLLIFLIGVSFLQLGSPPVLAAEPHLAKGARGFWLDVSLRPPLVDWFNAVAHPEDIARVENISQLELLDNVTTGRKLVVFKSAAVAEQMIPEIADRVDIIGYNLEQGPLNPEEEQVDPVGSAIRMRALADEYGLQLAFGPDRSFALRAGPEIAPYVDIFVLQVQRVQTNPATVLGFVGPLVPQLRAANPDLQVSVQVRTEGDVAAIGTLIEDLKPELDGVSILTSPETTTVAKALVETLQSPADERRSWPVLIPSALRLVENGQTEPAKAVNDLWLDVSLRPPMIDWYNSIARPDDIARVENVTQLDLLDSVTAGRKLVVFKSAADAERMIPAIADRVDIIGYNLEQGPLNPTDEQADPVGSAIRMRALADQYDLLLAFGPDRSFALSDGPAIAPYVDIFVLQVQRVQTDPATVANFVGPLVPQLRAANPDLQISVQVRTEGDVLAIRSLIEGLILDLDGVSVLTSPETTNVAMALIETLQTSTDESGETPSGAPGSALLTENSQPDQLGEPSVWPLVIGAFVAGVLCGGLLVTFILVRGPQ